MECLRAGAGAGSHTNRYRDRDRPMGSRRGRALLSATAADFKPALRKNAPPRCLQGATGILPVGISNANHGQDARGTLRCARNKRFRQMRAGLEARAPGETPTGLLPNTVAFATALAFPSGLLGPGERRGSLDPVARPERARPLTLPLPISWGEGTLGEADSLAFPLPPRCGGRVGVRGRAIPRAAQGAPGCGRKRHRSAQARPIQEAGRFRL